MPRTNILLNSMENGGFPWPAPWFLHSSAFLLHSSLCFCLLPVPGGRLILGRGQTMVVSDIFRSLSDDRVYERQVVPTWWVAPAGLWKHGKCPKTSSRRRPFIQCIICNPCIVICVLVTKALATCCKMSWIQLYHQPMLQARQNTSIPSQHPLA
jgi:hypothetical protein